jgi:hypothetical protein
MSADYGDVDANYSLGRLYESFQVDALPNLTLRKEEINLNLLGNYYEIAANGGNLNACVRVAQGCEKGELGFTNDGKINISKAYKYWKMVTQVVVIRYCYIIYCFYD